MNSLSNISVAYFEIKSTIFKKILKIDLNLKTLYALEELIQEHSKLSFIIYFLLKKFKTAAYNFILYLKSSLQRLYLSFSYYFSYYKKRAKKNYK